MIAFQRETVAGVMRVHEGRLKSTITYRVSVDGLEFHETVDADPPCFPPFRIWRWWR